MKVIKEEEAIYFRNHLAKQDRIISACAIDELIAGHSEEIDTLTVSKLRPICNTKIGDQILLVVDDYGIISGYKSSNDGDAIGNGHYFTADQVLGWLPLPIYKPELTGDGE